MSSKNKRFLSKRIALYLATGLLSCNLAYANPSDGNVVQGGATIGNGANNVLNITGVQNGTVINWNSFSIAAGETTSFAGSEAFAVLNRVTGSNLSEIYGTLTANNSGKVFLVNQNGIVIGSGAVINTGAFISSTLNVTNNDFTTYANGGTLVFDKTNNLATVNSGNSGDVKIQTTKVDGTALSGAINVTGDITLIGGTVSVAPGVTFTVTSGDLLLLAAKSVTYDPQNNNDGLSYAASAANTVTIGDGTSAKGLNITADNITLAGGAVTIAGPATATYSGSTDTTKNARINASGELDIYALNTKQESTATTDNVTTYTSVYSAGSDNTVAISGNVKINDKDSSGNAVSGNKVTIVGGKVSLTGIDDDHKVVINNINRGVSIRAINAATLTSNDTTSAGTTNLSAGAANSIYLSNAKIIAGRETNTGKTREINLQGGKISIANTRLEADGDQWDGVSMNAFTSFDKTATADGSSTTTFTMAADQSNTVSIADSTIITPEITVTGSTVGISNSFMDASDFVRMLAADKLVRTKTVQTGGNLRTEAVTATAANTLSLTDSSIKMNSFTGLWSDDNSSYNDSYDTTAFSDTRKDIQLVGGKVSLTGYKTATNTDGTIHTPGTIYDVSKNTDILVAAGKDVQYTYTDHNLDVTSLTSYSGAAANTVTIDISAAPVATYDSDAIITGRDVSIIGGTVNITGKAADTQPMIKATETTTGTGNVDILAVNTLSNTTDTGAQATVDNKVSLKDTAIATTTIDDTGSDIVITGGSITIDASTLTTPSGLELYAISKITAHNDDTNAYVPLTTELDKGTINATTGSGNAITITNSKLTGDVALIGNTITATGSTLQKNDAEDNVSLYAAGSITGTFDNDNETLSITATKDNAVILGSASAPVTITAGKDVNIVGGAVSITGSDGNKSTITATSDINVYAVDSLSKSSTDFTMSLAAAPDNALKVSYADMAVNSGGDSDNGIILLGGKVDIDHARLDTIGGILPGQENPTGVDIIAVTSFSDSWTKTPKDDPTLAIGRGHLTTASGNGVSVADSIITSPDFSIDGNTVKLNHVEVTASDYIGLYASNTMNSTETETTQITDDADIELIQIDATAANTLDIANSTLTIDSAKATSSENIQTDIHLIGGAVSLVNTVQTTNNTTDVLIAAGNTVEYEHRLHELTDANIKNYAATKDNTVTLSGSTLAPTDVTVVGGAVTVDAQSAINAATDATVFALNSLTQTLDATTHKATSLTATGTKDNAVILGSAAAPVTVTAGKDVNIAGGAVSITGGDGNKSTITASSDINVYAVNSLSKSDSNFTTTVAATPDNVLTVSYADMTVKSSGDSDNGIMLLGGKVEIDHAALDTTGTTIPGQQNPTAVTINAVTSASSNWTETSELAIGTASLATATGNSISVGNSTITSPDVGIYGNTTKLDNVQVTASDYIGLYAANTLNSTETETTQITTDADIESLQLTATAANTLNINNSALKIDTTKATPYENIQTDIQLIGGAVSLANTVQTTNNTTDVLIAAGNTVEYEHRLHELTDANIKNYAATKDNTVTLNGSTLAPTNVTVVGGAVTVDAQSVLNAATDATVLALNSLTQTLDATTHKATSLTATGTYDNSIANAGTISGANGVFLTSSGTITNSGSIVGTNEAEIVAWGEVKEQGTVTAPSYLVLSGDAVAAKSSDVTASTEKGVLSVNTKSTTYTVTSGYQPTVTATGSGSTVGISGQTKTPSTTSTIPTGQADEQPVVQVNQTVTNTILPVSTASPLLWWSASPLLQGSAISQLQPQTIAGSGVTIGAVAGGISEVAPGITMPVAGIAGQEQMGNPGNASAAPDGTSGAVAGGKTPGPAPAQPGDNSWSNPGTNAPDAPHR